MNVTLFTRSSEKEQDALRLGVDNIVISTNKEQMDLVNNKFDLIIDTVPYIHDPNVYWPSQSINGVLVPVVFPIFLEPTLNTTPLINRLSRWQVLLLPAYPKLKSYMTFEISTALQQI